MQFFNKRCFVPGVVPVDCSLLSLHDAELWPPITPEFIAQYGEMGFDEANAELDDSMENDPRANTDNN